MGPPVAFPGSPSGRECTCKCRRRKRSGFDPWVRKIPWRRKWQPILVFLPGESHGQRNLEGYSPWGCKELDTTEWLSTHTRYTLGNLRMRIVEGIRSLKFLAPPTNFFIFWISVTLPKFICLNLFFYCDPRGIHHVIYSSPLSVDGTCEHDGRERIFPGGSDGKASVYNAGDLGLIPGWGRFPGEGNGNPLQYSCLENPMDGGASCPWGGKESDTTERLHLHFQ